jgi:hypothetical protein
MNFKFDTIYSNWIFIWFLLYIVNLISFNPLFILIIGYMSVIFCLIYLYLKKINMYNFIKFSIININIKIIPIFVILYMNNYNYNVNIYDMIFSLVLTLIYITYILMYYNKNPLYYYHIILDTYIKNNDDYKSYASIIYDKLYKLIS